MNENGIYGAKSSAWSEGPDQKVVKRSLNLCQKKISRPGDSRSSNLVKGGALGMVLYVFSR